VIEAWQFSLSGNSGTRSEKKSLLCGGQKSQNPLREVLGNNRQPSQESWMELGLGLGRGSSGATIWIADAHRGDGKHFVVRADEILTAFLEAERAIHQFAVSLLS